MAPPQTERIVIYIAAKLLNLSCKFQVFPYKRVCKEKSWDLASLKLRTVARWKCVTLHSISWVLVATHWLVWIAGGLYDGLDLSFFIHFIFIMALSFFFVHSLEITSNPGGLMSIENGFEEMQSYFAKRWAQHPVAYLFSLSLPGIVVIVPITYAAIYVWSPTLPMFITAHAIKKLTKCAEGRVVQLICLVTGGCLELIIMLWITIALTTVQQTVNIVTFSLSLWLRELRARVGNTSRRGPWCLEREIQHCLKLYNILRIFNIMSNSFIGRSLMPAFATMLVGMISGCLFCTIQLYGVVPLGLYVFFPTFALFNLVLVIPGFAGQLGEVKLRSVLVRRDMRVMVLSLKMAMLSTKLTSRTEQVLVIRKRVDALSPIGMQLGCFGWWKLNTTADILYQVMSCTILLLAF